MVIGRRPRHAAREIDHVADRELGDRLHEAGTGAGHQHAGLRGGIDIDVADVDGAADEGSEMRQLRKDLAAPFRHAIGDDDVGVLCRIHEARGIERLITLVQDHVRNRPQTVQAAIAVIIAAHLRRVGQQDFHGNTPSVAECARQARCESHGTKAMTSRQRNNRPR